MLSHFKIRGILGKGGMGVVYRALDLRFNREIALKTILGAADPETVERFVREAKAAGRLKHPNIVPVFEHGVVKGVRYMALELVEGKSLLGVIRESGPMSPSSGASTVRDLAEAVAEAHAQGVLHRDLKPANVLLDKDSRPRLTDFGLARDERETDLTQTGDVLGTPVYMAPEQALGDKRAIGPATDVYGLGAILYEALAGQPPFTGRTGVEVLRKVVEEEPPSPTAVRLGRGLAALPPDLETICQKCLEKAPERRYASARELARDLRSFLDGEPIAARPATRLERARRFVRRNRVVSALAGFLVSLLLLVAVAAVVAIVREHLEHQRETRRVAEVVVREQETLKNARLRALHMWFAPGLEDGARGQLYSSMGNLRAAAEEYARLAGPRDERAASGLIATYRSIGETLLELGDGEAAVVLLRKAGEPEARIDSAREQHRLYIEVGQANAYGDAGEYAQSEELLTRLLVAHPNLYWALAYRGCQRNLTNDPRGALSDLTEALHLAKEPCCHLLLECSRSRYLLGDLPGAERDCDAALKLEPDYYPAFVSRANVRRRLGDYPGALRDAIEARRVPDARRLMPEVDIVYAESLWQTGEREKGEAEMTRVLDRPGMAMRMPHVHWFRSKMRAARGDRTGAIEDLRAFLAVIDKGPDADDARAFLATLESGH
jgi:tetratricopeptide (TPR) repeat protein